MTELLLILTGFVSGALAGLFGIGGGVVLVVCLQGMGFSYSESIATSSLAIVITSVAGSCQNLWMGYLKINKVMALAIPAMITSLLATNFVYLIADNILQFCFGLLLLLNIYYKSSEKEILKL